MKKYAIRIDCNFEIEDSKITLQVDLDKATFKTIETKEESVSWSDFELNNELPTKEIVNTGIGEITKPIQIPSGFIILKVENKRISEMKLI